MGKRASSFVNRKLVGERLIDADMQYIKAVAGISDEVVLVADNVDEVVVVAENIDAINAVTDSAAAVSNMTAIANTLVPGSSATATLVVDIAGGTSTLTLGLPEGDEGQQGVIGATGATGNIGNTGATGAPGKDGIDGAVGMPGQPGQPGIPGDDGTDGQDGTNGQDGQDGATGLSGTNGSDGKDGTGIVSVDWVSSTGSEQSEAGEVDSYQVLDDYYETIGQLNIKNGRSIETIVMTHTTDPAGNPGAIGARDTYTIYTRENGGVLEEIGQFQVRNGDNVDSLTPTRIKEIYESNPDTNAFTDSEKSKLTDIEDGATEDQVASEVPVTPVGELLSTDVQAGLEELTVKSTVNRDAIAVNGQDIVVNKEAITVNKDAIVVNKDAIEINTQAIVNLATAQSEIEGTQTAGYVFNPIPTAFTVTPVGIVTQSTDTTMFEVNGDSTITFKQNASYNFHNSLGVESGTNQERLLEFQVVNTLDDTVVYSRAATVETSIGDNAQLEMLGLLTIGRNGMPNAPVTLRMEMRQVEEDYSLVSFHSIVSSGTAYDAVNVEAMDLALGLEYEAL